MKTWQDCVAFHGHECGGLTIGYKASLYAIELLNLEFSADEQVVCIAENDACGIDGHHIVLGITLVAHKGIGRSTLGIVVMRGGHNIAAVDDRAMDPATLTRGGLNEEIALTVGHQLHLLTCPHRAEGLALGGQEIVVDAARRDGLGGTGIERGVQRLVERREAHNREEHQRKGKPHHPRIDTSVAVQTAAEGEHRHEIKRSKEAAQEAAFRGRIGHKKGVKGL